MVHHYRKIIIIGVLLGLLLIPSTSVLATEPEVEITVSAFIVGIPGDFTLTYVNDHQVDIEWTMGKDAVITMVRAAVGRPPEDITAGYLVYTGNLTYCSDTGVSLDETGAPVYYRAWSQREDGRWSPMSAEEDIQGVGMTLIAFAMVIMGLMTLGFIFRQAVLFVVAGFASIGLGIILFGQEALSESWMFGWVSVILGFACFVLSVLVYYWVKGKEWKEEQERISKLPPVLSEEEEYSRLLSKETAEPRRIVARGRYNRLLRRPSSEFQRQENRE